MPALPLINAFLMSSLSYSFGVEFLSSLAPVLVSE